jgi:DNA-binding MarR family transcriptional regulator
MAGVLDWQQHPVWPLVISLARLENARRVADAASRLGLAERRLLWLFADGRPRTMRQVADEVGLDLSTVSRQVAGALKEGLLRRRREPGQASQLLESTGEGQERLHQDFTWHTSIHEAALTAVPEAERARFSELLQTFVAAYVHVAGQPDDPGDPRELT